MARDQIATSTTIAMPRRSYTRVGAWALLLSALLVTGAASADESREAPVAQAVAHVSGLVDTGQFKAAEAEIAEALEQANLSAHQRQALSFERERMRRILLDFPHAEDAVKTRLRELIPDMRAEEFVAWDTSGLLEHQMIDGRKLYFDRAVSNLFRLSPAAAARRKLQTPFNDSPLETLHRHHREVRAQALASGRSSVTPHRVRVTQSLIVNADAVPPGETLHAWIPFPRAIPGQQEDIGLLASTPSQHVLAPESTLQRTVSMQKNAEAGRKTEFSINYEVTIFGRYFDIDPDKVVPAQITPELAPHTGERAPHVVYTDAIRKFSREVVGDEKNPYRIAQKLFAAVDQRIPWAGAREYSTLSNISEYAVQAGHGDCGQQTLLLMTLLRLNDIPARWQSGMIFSDGDYDNLHDWGQLYLAPYGWVPMDVTFGRLGSAGTGPADPKLADPALEWFYLGGLDAYRIAFNDDYAREFVPGKQHFRSETVDSQRGEVEWQSGNLYFDQWDYSFEWEILPAPPVAN